MHTIEIAPEVDGVEWKTDWEIIVFDVPRKGYQFFATQDLQILQVGVCMN